MELSRKVSSILEEANKIVNNLELDDFSLEDDLAPFQMPSLVFSTSLETVEVINVQDDDNEDMGSHAMDQALMTAVSKATVEKPKRPLSAYNFFFQLERERIIAGNSEKPITPRDVANISTPHQRKPLKRRHRKTHGKIGFADLARTIAAKWKALDKVSKMIFEDRAEKEKARYKREIEAWTAMQAHVEPSQKVDSDEWSPLHTNIDLLHKEDSDIPFEIPLQSRERDGPPSVSPVSPHSVPGFGSMQLNSDSLNAMLMQGQNYARCHAQMVREYKQMEQKFKQVLMEHQQATMRYSSNFLAMQAVRQPYQGYMSAPPQVEMYPHQMQPNMVDSFSPYNSATAQDDYFGMADQAFKMAQVALPMPGQFMPSMEMRANAMNLGNMYNTGNHSLRGHGYDFCLEGFQGLPMTPANVQHRTDNFLPQRDQQTVQPEMDPMFDIWGSADAQQQFAPTSTTFQGRIATREGNMASLRNTFEQ